MNTRGFKKGNVPWNKGKTGFIQGKPAWNKGKTTSKEVKEKMSKTHSGKVFTEEHRIHMSQARIGMKFSPTHRQAMSAVNKGKKSGARSNFWKGGITPINKMFRTSVEYKEWRKHVFNRDDYTCQACGTRSMKGNPVYLHADHVMPFSLYPSLRLEILNGRTLCAPCHRKTSTWGNRARNYDLATIN